MRLCTKHENYVYKVNKNADMNEVISKFTNIIPLEKQEIIDRTKEQCMCCVMGFEYKKKLREIAKG